MNDKTKTVTKSGITAGTTAPFSFALVALNVFVVVLAVVGVIVAALTFTGDNHAAADDHGGGSTDFGIGGAVDTSFGSIFVGQVETLDGLSAEQLGGMTHGIADLVEQEEAKVTIAVLLANRSTHPIAIAPGDYALFVDGASEPIPPSSSTIQPLMLKPGSSVNITVTFVVPRTGAEISMGYADPGGQAIVVPVGSVDQAPLDISAGNHAADNGDGSDDGHDHDHEDDDQH